MRTKENSVNDIKNICQGEEELEIPNVETIAAIKEVEEMQKHPDMYKGYTDVHEMMIELLTDALQEELQYRGFIGSVDYSAEIYYGRIMGIRALVSYEGNTLQEMISDFHTAVDNYLALCDAEGIEPEKPHEELTRN